MNGVDAFAAVADRRLVPQGRPGRMTHIGKEETMGRPHDRKIHAPRFGAGVHGRDA